MFEGWMVTSNYPFHIKWKNHTSRVEFEKYKILEAKLNKTVALPEIVFFKVVSISSRSNNFRTWKNLE